MTYLNFAKFYQTLAQLEASRFAAIGTEIVGTIEIALNLGLALDQIENLQNVLASAKSLDSTIVSIGVLGPTGNPLVATAGDTAILPASIGTKMLVQGFEEYWHGEGSSGSYVALPITNSFGESAGLLVLNYSNRNFQIATSAVWEQLRTALAKIWVFAAALTGPLVLLACYRFTRQLRRLSAELDGSSKSVAASEGERSDDLVRGTWTSLLTTLRLVAAPAANRQ
ncbi:MAG: hypothetical protein AAFY56_06010 [Pseudomonadota bacterium]